MDFFNGYLDDGLLSIVREYTLEKGKENLVAALLNEESIMISLVTL